MGILGAVVFIFFTIKNISASVKAAINIITKPSYLKCSSYSTTLFLSLSSSLSFLSSFLSSDDVNKSPSIIFLSVSDNLSLHTDLIILKSFESVLTILLIVSLIILALSHVILISSLIILILFYYYYLLNQLILIVYLFHLVYHLLI